MATFVVVDDHLRSLAEFKDHATIPLHLPSPSRPSQSQKCPREPQDDACDSCLLQDVACTWASINRVLPSLFASPLISCIFLSSRPAPHTRDLQLAHCTMANTSNAVPAHCQATFKSRCSRDGSVSSDAGSDSSDEFPDIATEEGWAKFVEIIRRERQSESVPHGLPRSIFSKRIAS